MSLVDVQRLPRRPSASTTRATQQNAVLAAAAARRPTSRVDPALRAVEPDARASCPPTGCAPRRRPADSSDGDAGPGRRRRASVRPGPITCCRRRRAALERAPVRFARTARHPAVAELAADGITFETLRRGVRRRARPRAGVRARSSTRWSPRPTSTARSCTRCPGARRSPSAPSRCCASRAVEVVLVPGLVVRRARVGAPRRRPDGRDARVVDGRAIDLVELAGPAAHRAVRQPVRAVRREARAARAPRPRHAGHRAPASRSAPTSRSCTVPLAELDRGASSPTTSPRCSSTPAPAGAAREMVRLLPLAKRLRDPGGCPWDAEQTHHSLTRYLLEESYEVVEAIEALPADGPRRRRRVRRARRRARRPAVPGGVPRGARRRRPARSPWPTSPAASTTSSCAATRTCSATSWPTRPATSCATGSRSRRTRRARRRSSRASRPGLPSLLYTHKLFRKAASVGLDPGDLDEALDRIDAAVGRLRARAATTSRPTSRELLAAAVVVARAGGVDAESALRGWAATLPAPLRGHGAARRWPATSTSPPSTPPASPPSGSKPGSPPPPLRTSDDPPPPAVANRQMSGQSRSMAGMVPMRPALKSSTAWRISSRVFITNGP